MASLLELPTPSMQLSPSYAPIHASILTLSYVGGFYLSPTIRKLPKDDPRVMKSRLRVAGVVTALGWLGTAAVLWTAEQKNLHFSLVGAQVLSLLGISLPLSVPSFLTSSVLPLKPTVWTWLTRHALPALVIPLCLTASLFAGPLYTEWLDDNLPIPSSKQRKDVNGKPVAEKSAWAKSKEWLRSWWNLYGLRNLVVGPLTEEIIWRSCILSVYHFSGASKRWMIFGTPLWFGVAHIHHAWETYKSRGRTSSALQFAMLQSGVQFTYTTLFGWYANFLFLRTGSIIPPLLSHVFCNIMGLPNPFAALQDFPDHKLSICTAYLAGIAFFAYGLLPATDPALYGGSVYWR